MNMGRDIRALDSMDNSMLLMIWTILIRDLKDLDAINKRER